MTLDQKFPTWKLLWHLMCYTPKLYVIDSVFWIIFMSLPGVTGFIIRAFFDKLTNPSALNLSLWAILVLLVATDLGNLAVLFTCRFTKSQLRFTMSALVQRNLFVHLLNRPGASPMTTSADPTNPLSAGEAISYFRDDADQIQDAIATISEVMGAGVLAVGAIALLLRINAGMTLLAFLPLMGMMVLVQQTQKHIKHHRQGSRQATEQVTGFINEIFSTVQAIKIAGAQTQVLHHFQTINEQRRRMMVKDGLLTAVLKSAFENLYSIGTGLVLLVAAQSLQSSANRLSVGDFALFVFYLPYVTYFLEFLGDFLTLIKQTEVSFERMAAVLPRVAARSPLSPVHSSDRHAHAYTLVAHTPLYLNNLWGRRPALPPVEQPIWDETIHLQSLTADYLTYHYPNTDHGITNIHLSIPRGSLTVITGAVGSGKTTLLRVLLGLLPMQAGEIYWNHHKVTDPAHFFVPPRSAYTPQIPRLFSASLRDNILLGLERNESELETAIAQAIFAPDLATLSDGLETVIGTRGVRLSGGQLQRAAAARMLIRQAELLVFDDLSSALDVNTEQLLWMRLLASRDALHQTQQDFPKSVVATSGQPTCLIVSHRPWILRHADHIIVLEHGQIQAKGSFDELKSRLPM